MADAAELKIVKVVHGKGDLGIWGSILLTGARSATIARTVTVPPDVAADLPFSIVVLDPSNGHVVIFPHRGDRIVAFDLNTGEALFDPISLERDPDPHLRLAACSILMPIGVAYLTESSMMMFDSYLQLLWRRDGQFGGWEVEAWDDATIRLVTTDWGGSQERQVRSASSGERMK